jgi:hypothetical protein
LFLHFPKQWWKASGSPQLSHRIARWAFPSLLDESVLLFLFRHMGLPELGAGSLALYRLPFDIAPQLKNWSQAITVEILVFVPK